MAFAEYMDRLRALMLGGIVDGEHQRLALHAAQFAEGIIAKLGPYDYGLARESRVDKPRVARAISRFTGRNVHWTTVVSVPRGMKGSTAWWADTDAYRRTLATAYQLDNVLPSTARASSTDQRAIADKIARHLSDIGYSANYSVGGATEGLVWGAHAMPAGYAIWYNTLFPVLKALCLAAAFNQPKEADRVVELATVLRDVLPLGERNSQEFAWVVLAAPNP